MRPLLLTLTLLALTTPGATPSAAEDASARAIVGTPAQPLPWPPPLAPPAPGAASPRSGTLHFRGPLPGRPRGLVAPLAVDSVSGPFLDMSLREHRVMFELRGEWESAGLCTDSTYDGRFVYRDEARDPRLRGAQGTHAAIIDPDGIVHVHVTFDDPKLAPFDMKWVPWRQRDSLRAREITREELRGLDARMMVHPVWPPPKPGTPGN